MGGGILHTFKFFPSLLHVPGHVDEEVFHFGEAGGEDSEGTVVTNIYHHQPFPPLPTTTN